ncbi:hypothetical protein [Candidatus Macondimonas diazotrophica]|uniref:Uncharacterized protein n=1 Tax=Candidatus Macondimonas diazotrophica TaxID=2305248 RepID=A0A4Z0F553_9GAMM|nr:hypothetical protein [Candidatus Macondimonas diazotrophica]TFZ81407.1 hypothetical protein E4680_12585 [Candidatus Macondimonas diazotrophica]
MKSEHVLFSAPDIAILWRLGYEVVLLEHGFVNGDITALDPAVRTRKRLEFDKSNGSMKPAFFVANALH